MAGEISTRLRERLTGEQKAKLNDTGTSDPEAYQLFLKGQFYFAKRTPDGLTKARVIEAHFECVMQTFLPLIGKLRFAHLVFTFCVCLLQTAKGHSFFE